MTLASLGNLRNLALRTALVDFPAHWFDALGSTFTAGTNGTCEEKRADW